MAGLGAIYRDWNAADSRADAYIDLDEDLDCDGRPIADSHSYAYPAPQRHFDHNSDFATFQYAKTAHENFHPCADLDLITNQADQHQSTLADPDPKSNTVMLRPGESKKIHPIFASPQGISRIDGMSASGLVLIGLVGPDSRKSIFQFCRHGLALGA